VDTPVLGRGEGGRDHRFDVGEGTLARGGEQRPGPLQMSGDKGAEGVRGRGRRWGKEKRQEGRYLCELEPISEAGAGSFEQTRPGVEFRSEKNTGHMSTHLRSSHQLLRQSLPSQWSNPQPFHRRLADAPPLLLHTNQSQAKRRPVDRNSSR
jgi:hypothetical protein